MKYYLTVAILVVLCNGVFSQPECPENMEYFGCGPCNPTCDTPQIACTLDCKSGGCGCKSGFVMNQDGKCIKFEDCPKKNCSAEANMQFYPCGWCKATCARPKPPCPKICLRGGDCGCKKNYVLDKVGGKCIKFEDCPLKTCSADDNMQFYPCGWCNATCARPTPPCPEICLSGGNCGCKENYVLDKVGGKCISKSQCPKP